MMVVFKSKEYNQIFVDVLIHHEAEQKVERNNEHFIDSAKVNQQTVQCKKF